MKLSALLTTAICACSASGAHGATAAEYDVVIIGSGPGGLVAAEYLSRASYNLSVLVLEAGDVSLQESGGTDTLAYTSASGLTKFDVPGEFDNTIYNTANEKYRIDWITAPYMWLGKLVGGCSSINAALYFRTPDSYVEKASWPFSAEQVTAGYDANEKFYSVTETPSSDGEHYLQEAYKIVGDALAGIGYSAKTLNDKDARNAKSKTFGHPPYAINKGLRDAPAKTFYKQMKARDNFKLLTNSKVLYIAQDAGQASAVVYENAAQEKITQKLSSRGVVIVAAGALNTPQVLMQSGVGPAKELEALAALNTFDGVKEKSAWVENANVGQQVFDTNVVYASFSHDGMKPFLNKKNPQAAITQFVKDQSGPWAITGPVLIAYESMTVGDREYDFQTTVLPHGFDDAYETDEAYSFGIFLNNPESRDYISVGSSGTFNVATKGAWYLSTSNDLKAMQTYATKVISTATEAGSKFLSGNDVTSAGIASWVKKNAGSVTHHFGGSCYTSSDKTDSKRCADENFKVVGTKNIYVSDASLMKEGTVNPYGFVMYIGHQAAKNVLQEAFQVAPTSSDATGSAAAPNASTPSTSSEVSSQGIMNKQLMYSMSYLAASVEARETSLSAILRGHFDLARTELGFSVVAARAPLRVLDHTVDGALLLFFSTWALFAAVLRANDHASGSRSCPGVWVTGAPFTETAHHAGHGALLLLHERGTRLATIPVWKRDVSRVSLRARDSITLASVVKVGDLAIHRTGAGFLLLVASFAVVLWLLVHFELKLLLTRVRIAVGHWHIRVVEHAAGWTARLLFHEVWAWAAKILWWDDHVAVPRLVAGLGVASPVAPFADLAVPDLALHSIFQARTRQSSMQRLHEHLASPRLGSVLTRLARDRLLKGWAGPASATLLANDVAARIASFTVVVFVTVDFGRIRGGTAPQAQARKGA